MKWLELTGDSISSTLFDGQEKGDNEWRIKTEKFGYFDDGLLGI
jgi:hypothetical protein